MVPQDNPNWFANSPLIRLNSEHDQDDLIAKALNDPANLMLPLWRGDPLVVDGKAGFLSVAARGEFPSGCLSVALGMESETAYFAVDVSDASDNADTVPFADMGTYLNMREAASVLPRGDLAIAGHARWLFEWHRRHQYCAVCGGSTRAILTGAKRRCERCEAEHFPRSDPVAIVLAIHGNACLLGRGPHFPPGVLSALAGFVEAGETPEDAAKRELFEEAGIHLSNIRYQFSQPWPFPSSMMMGFFADSADRELTLDAEEIVEARWIDKDDIRAVLGGEERDFIIPPKFTIARQLLERWARL